MGRKVIALLVIMTVLLSACNKVSLSKKENTDGEILGNGEIKEEIKEEVKEPSDVTEVDDPSWKDSDDTETGKHSIAIDKGYVSSFMEVNLLGAEEYKTIEGTAYKDQAPVGEKYLVVYLEIKNFSFKNEYFNYNYFKSYCDGKEIQTTFLVNDPKGHKSIFNDIPANGQRQGYVVYKVPEEWQKVEMIYTGLKDSRELELKFNITADSLKDVEAIQ